MKFSNIKIVVVLLFILSGICGLIYEVVWSKYLALFIGSTAYAHMIVLATYMGGLALGAIYWGRFSDKFPNQLKLYGWLEIGIGVYCLAYPFVIEYVGDVFISLASALDGTAGQAGILSLKFLLSFITLIIPTFLMGGTLPILSKFVSKRISDSGKDVAVLYYINSFGAVIGTALAGFFLIRIYGVETTILATAIVNILIGLTAFTFSKSSKPNVDTKTVSTPNVPERQQFFSKKEVRIALITALLAGFIAMLYELAWIRLLSNILGSTTYSFTLMLIAFISGIALGSLIVSFIIKKIKNKLAFLAFCQIATALSMILMLPIYQRLPYFLMQLSEMVVNTPDNFSTFLSLEFLLCFIIMVVPTIFSGMSLPVASRIVSQDIKLLGKSVGGIFSINTIGSVIGALATGLLFIPLLGVKSTLEFGVLLNAFVGILILLNTSVSKILKASFTSVLVLCLIGYKLLFPTWNQNFLISGVFRTLYTKGVSSYSEFVRLQNEGQRILWHKEGVNANVAVRESQFAGNTQKTLVINGKADASTVADLPTQVLLGQIPLMLYPNSGDALVIGLGSGITCGSALRHPIKSLDVVEIASEVVECNWHFATENYNFTKDPRVKIFIDDAITKLKTSSKKYDYIISEPSNPWIAGIGNLYSQEFFELCKNRMNKNGVLTQWFHTYDVNNDIFKLVLSTISSVFPHVSIWKASDADIIILASASPQVVNFAEMEQKMNQLRIATDLARIKMYDVPTLLSLQVVSARNNPYVYEKNMVNAADKSPLEFMAPVALFTHEAVTLLDSLDERFSFQDKNLEFTAYEKQRSLSFENYMNIARFRSGSHCGDFAIAYTALRKALELNPSNIEAITLLASISDNLRLPEANLRQSQLAELRTMYELNPSDNETIFTYLNALVEYYRIENSIVNPQPMNDIVSLMRKSMQLNRAYEDKFRYIMSMVLTGAGRYNEAAEEFKGLMQYYELNGPSSATVTQNELLYLIGECYYNAGNLIEAENYFKRLQAIDPYNKKLTVAFKKINSKK